MPHTGLRETLLGSAVVHHVLKGGNQPRDPSLRVFAIVAAAKDLDGTELSA